jgi:hypothetical protein
VQLLWVVAANARDERWVPFLGSVEIVGRRCCLAYEFNGIVIIVDAA